MIRLCDRCEKPYRVEDNREDACTFHPGAMLDYNRLGRAGMGLGGDFWECCGRQVESDPFDVPGCATGPHVPSPHHDGRSTSGLLRHEAREQRSAAAARAEEGIADFLRGSEGLGEGERWRALFTAARTLEDTAPAAAIGLLSSTEFPLPRRQALFPLFRSTVGMLPEAEPAGLTGSGEWRLDRLFRTFPSLLPDSRGAASTPLGPASGVGQSSDGAAEVMVTLAPSSDFILRVDSPPQDELVRGVLEGAVHLVTPPALACEIAVEVVRGTGALEEKALHAAGYRAFEAASARCKWAFASAFPIVEPPKATESGETTYERIAAAFEYAGFDVDRSASRLLTREERNVMSVFTTRVAAAKGGGVTHFFFMCPYPWTLKWRQDFEAAWHRLSYSEAHDGYDAVRHVLSKFPHPDGSVWP